MAETFIKRVRANSTIHIPKEVVDTLKLERNQLVRVTIEPQSQKSEEVNKSRGG